MILEFIESSRVWLNYAVQICMVVFCFSVLFLIYAKYKTGRELKGLVQLYFAIIAKSTILTGLLLVAFFVLTKYVPVFHIIVFLLCVSSVSILLKYVSIIPSKKTMLVDICIVLINVYCAYVLITQEQFGIYHYVLLACIAFCFFGYQQIKKIA